MIILSHTSSSCLNRPHKPQTPLKVVLHMLCSISSIWFFSSYSSLGLSITPSCPSQIISTLLLISWFWGTLPSAKLVLEILSHPAHSIFHSVKEDLTLQFLVKQRGRPFVSYHYIYYVQSAEGGRRSEQRQCLLLLPTNVNCSYLATAKPSSLVDIKRSCHFSAVLETLMKS